MLKLNKPCVKLGKKSRLNEKKEKRRGTQYGLQCQIEDQCLALRVMESKKLSVYHKASVLQRGLAKSIIA